MLETRPQVRRVSDEDLRECVRRGMRAAEIARHFDVTQSAISQRLKKLNLSTTAALVAPVESQRYVRRQVDALEQLAKNVERANLLQDACDEWLRDAEDPTKYDIGPRAGEIDVTYCVEVRTDSGYRTLKRKKKLDQLLSDLEGADDDGARFQHVEKTEFKHADPRELILKTQQESRSTVQTGVELMQKIADHRAAEALREAILSEIAKESPEFASRIAEAVRRSILLYTALGGPLAVPEGDAN